MKRITFTISIFITMAFSMNVQALDFKLKNISPSQEISAMLTNPTDTSYSNYIDTLESDGSEYSGSIPFNRTFYITIFAGLNPKGRMYKIMVNPNKTKTVFLEWNDDTKTLRPQKPEKKYFFSKDTNIKESEIIIMP